MHAVYCLFSYLSSVLFGVRMPGVRAHRMSATAGCLCSAALRSFAMPAAKPPLPIERPAPIRPDEAEFIRATVSRFYGPDAVVRTYRPDPAHLKIHAEVSGEPGMKRYDCAGMLLAHLEREHIGFIVTARGTKPRAGAKVAYRQGVIL